MGIGAEAAKHSTDLRPYSSDKYRSMSKPMPPNPPSMSTKHWIACCKQGRTR